MRSVRIAGVGMTAFGRQPDRTGRDLFREAAAAAFEDADVQRADIDHCYVGNFVGDVAEKQGHQAPLMTNAAGLTVPATRFENACASGGAAFRGALQALQSDSIDVALVGGVETMTAMTTAEVTEALAMAADELYESRVGVTFPGAYALMQRAYFDEYGGTREDLAHVSKKNHANAVVNEHAQYQREIAVNDVLEAPTVADPIGLYDSCPVTDGAAAVILVSEEYAESHAIDSTIAVTGAGQGGDTLALQDRESLSRTPATERAAAEAYAQAEITPADVDLAEVHDCFTIAEVLALEGLGFYRSGEGIGAATRGETTMDGDLPVNLSGGLKAKGHPVGATGVGQVAELTRLLRGDHPRSGAVAGAQTGVTHNAGGTVASAYVHVLEVVA